jgi:hypothetical protein
MEVLLVAQLIVAVEGEAEKVIGPVKAPAQTTISDVGTVNTGGLGSVKEKGPTILEGHPFRITEISE